MSNFDDELSSYLQARTASDNQEKQVTAAANAAADALFGATSHSTFPFPHPQEFLPTPDAPAFAFNTSSQLWHDANTGTFSYYDSATETYIPVEAPTTNTLDSYDRHHQIHQHQHTSSNNSASIENIRYHVDPNTGYSVELPGYGEQGKDHDKPPESDATLRLCVLSSNVLKVGGVIIMDASGLSFGRDRPSSGQGSRVRMVEMEISRFHASIFLDRKEIVQKEETREQRHVGSSSSASSSPTSSSAFLSSSNNDNFTRVDRDPSSSSITKTSNFETAGQAVNSLNDLEDKAETSSGIIEKTPFTNPKEEQEEGEARDDDGGDKEDGEIPDSPSAGTKEENIDQKDFESGDLQKKNKSVDELYHQPHDHRWPSNEHEQYYFLNNIQPLILDTFQITDCGSTHGTFLNGVRLSAPKTASRPVVLSHMDRLEMGSTVFEIHSHEGGKICGACQISEDNEIEVLGDKDRENGNKSTTASGKNSPMLTSDIRLTREQERIEEMNRLRKKWTGPEKKTSGSKRYGAMGAGGDVGEEQREYVDRAAKRRLYFPDRSSPVSSMESILLEYPTFETTSGIHVPMDKSNKGHAMLSKMGWKAGTGLGAARQGVVEPIQLKTTEGKLGFGAVSLRSQGDSTIASSESFTEAARRKARERFATLK